MRILQRSEVRRPIFETKRKSILASVALLTHMSLPVLDVLWAKILPLFVLILLSNPTPTAAPQFLPSQLPRLLMKPPLLLLSEGSVMTLLGASPKLQQ